MINHDKIFVKKWMNFNEILDKVLLNFSGFLLIYPVFCHKKFYGYMLICRNAEGVHAHPSKC